MIPPPLHHYMMGLQAHYTYIQSYTIKLIILYLYSQNGVISQLYGNASPMFIINTNLQSVYIIILRNIFIHINKIGNTVGIKAIDLKIRLYRKQSKCRVSIVNIARTSNMKES